MSDRKKWARTLTLHAVLILGCVIFSFPFYWLLTTSMKERTELSGGCFHVDSEAGVGTVVRARWPDG